MRRKLSSVRVSAGTHMSCVHLESDSNGKNSSVKGPHFTGSELDRLKGSPAGR